MTNKFRGNICKRNGEKRSQQPLLASAEPLRMRTRERKAHSGPSGQEL